MPKVTANLEEQYSDSRANELAYKFLVENNGDAPIEIRSITPRIPEGVQLVDIKDPSLALPKSQHAKLCKEITTIINDTALVLSEDFRKAYTHTYAEATKELFRAVFGSASGMFRLFLQPSDNAAMVTLQGRMEAYRIKVENADQAKLAFDSLVKSETKLDANILAMMQFKLHQLEEVEELMAQASSKFASTVEADSFYAATYVLRFPRSIFETRKYNIGIDVSFSNPGEEKQFVAGANTSMIISPSPLVLTLIAIVSSILGVVLRIAITPSTTTPPNDFWPRIIAALTGNEVISAVILALVFFNVFEFTELGKQFKLNIAWRSALLIGSLCGLLTDRILAAIQGFIGP